MKYSVLLHNIRSAHNVGSLFRTADGAGFHHVYCSGYTPLPIDRFGRNRTDIAKVSLGAEQSLPWSFLEDPIASLKAKKNEGVLIVALEQDPKSIPLSSFVVPKGMTELILIVGEETKGVPEELLACADTIIELHMKGSKESLNVSVAFGIAAYHITNE